MTEQTYPIVENLSLVDPTATQTYIEMLFGYVEWAGDIVGLRGIGEDGTTQRTRFKEPAWINPAFQPIGSSVAQHAARWGQHHVATFIVPAVLHADAAQRRKAEEADIALFTTMLTDLDTGDTAAKLRFLEASLGAATMVVNSGGMTDAGMPKLHVYWALNEPTDMLSAVAGARHALALKCGGDPSFQRMTQVIRVPGSVHAKHGRAKTVSIASYQRGREYELSELLEKIEDMPTMPGLPAVVSRQVQIMLPDGSGAVDFNPATWRAAAQAPIEQAMTMPVHAGAVDGDRTRWGEFNRVAGWNIHLAREGRTTIDEAASLTHAWMTANMVPVWDDQRFRDEFRGLLAADVTRHGPMAPEAVQAEPLRVSALTEWAVGRMFMGEAPARRFLVDGIIMAGKPHMLVADSGIGKTSLCLTLGLAIALGTGTPWTCSKVSDGYAGGGTVVMLTAEDDRDEIHKRLDEMDPTGHFRRTAGDRFIVLPLLNVGGSFSLVERDARGNPSPSSKWRDVVGHLGALSGLAAVIIDTYSATAHGDENAAEVANEWFRAATEPVCGRLGAALVVTHHIKKTGPDAPISSASEMRNAVRGSGASIANARAVIGVWPEPDWKNELRLMGLDPRSGLLYKMAVVKGNNPELLKETIPLVRDETGQLVYRQGIALLSAPAKRADAARAWMLFVIKEGSSQGRPFTASTFFKRAGELPPVLRGMSRGRLEGMAKDMISEGSIMSHGRGWLDVPGGKFTRDDMTDRKQAFKAPVYDLFTFDESLGEVVSVARQDARWGRAEDE